MTASGSATSSACVKSCVLVAAMSTLVQSVCKKHVEEVVAFIRKIPKNPRGAVANLEFMSVEAHRIAQLRDAALPDVGTEGRSPRDSEAACLPVVRTRIWHSAASGMLAV